jgi:protein SCO1/2
MNSRRLWLAVAAAMIVAFGLGWMRFTAPPAGNLAGAKVGGHFSLTNQDGKRISDRDFDGKYRLMYFGYTFCPDICPTDVAAMTRGLKSYAATRPARAANVQPMFITIDPERDDAKAVKAFVSAFSPRLIGLTGTPAEIDAVRKTFAVYAKKAPGDDPANYLVDHSAAIYLFGPKGAPIAFLTQPTDKDVTAMLETYVR